MIVEDDSNFPFDINADLLIPFAVVVAVCFITMISFMVRYFYSLNTRNVFLLDWERVS